MDSSPIVEILVLVIIFALLIGSLAATALVVSYILEVIFGLGDE